MIKMLVVDDEIEICDFLKNFFSEKQYEVVTALNGQDAIKKIQDINPELMLLDVRMPGLSGIEVLRKVRDHNKSVKIIMVTAVENQDLMRLARELGANDYITKPFSLDYLENNVMEKVAGLAA
ncbi:MAG: response regulator [Candidatus Omnitrophica bacterium]|nr:response regulator [Candidatus Omnitrophota bacterium]